MARISSMFSAEKDLGVFTIESSATMEEFLAAVNSIDPEARPSNIIWDASRGTVEDIESGQLKEITRFLKAGHGMRPGGKTALVGPADVDFGIGRMFQAYAAMEKLTVQYRTFRTMAAAEAWIASDES